MLQVKWLPRDETQPMAPPKVQPAQPQPQAEENLFKANNVFRAFKQSQPSNQQEDDDSGAVKYTGRFDIQIENEKDF